MAEVLRLVISLFAGELRRRMMKNPGPRNLRRNQECRNDGRHTDQSQKLIHRKHGCPPKPIEKALSIRPVRRLMIAGQNLV